MSNKIACVVLSSEKCSSLLNICIDKLHASFASELDSVWVGTDAVNSVHEKLLAKQYVNGFIEGPVASVRLEKALEKINTSYVLVILDDYIIEQVDKIRLEKGLSYLPLYGFGALKLVPITKPSIALSGTNEFGIIEPLEQGKLNTQPTIYHAPYLSRLIRSNESLWEYEVNHNIRSFSEKEQIVSCFTPIVFYKEVVKRGKLRRWFYRKYKSQLADMTEMSLFDELYFSSFGCFNRVVIFLFGFNLLKKIKRVLWRAFFHEHN